MNAKPILMSATRLFTPRVMAAKNLRLMSSYRPVDFKPPTLDEMPVPQGSWQDDYNSKQRKNNLQLIAGLSLFSFTIYVLCTHEKIFFNTRRPPLPECGEC